MAKSSSVIDTPFTDGIAPGIEGGKPAGTTFGTPFKGAEPPAKVSVQTVQYVDISAPGTNDKVKPLRIPGGGASTLPEL
jgi:hypothetical protein